MSAQFESEQQIPPLPAYHAILLAADSSDHANRGLKEALGLGQLWNARITGTHVYAAKLHDVRFRQMEGGLPEQFREEDELERQRDVHDDLISKGLSIITDSYLDQAERACREASLAFARCALEGKNYRELVQETNRGPYDLLIMGALGLGAVQGSRLGTVCRRVARRSQIDTLVIKDPDRSLQDGPIVVAIDGSPHAYGGLLTAFALARQWEIPVKVVAAFDPYYHYVAFNRIADVLSEEAGKVFRFQEQEKLHEEIIDSGLARIYQGHLDVARSMADDYGIAIETQLLDGKPHDAIERYLKTSRPSLLIVGKLGIHADAELDIGGTAENLLHNADCAVLLSQREYQPRIDVVADTTTSWTTQAEQRMAAVPEFVQGMARMAILRYAQERGHTVITASIVEQATAQLCPGHAKQAMSDIVAAHEAGELARNPAAPLVMGWSDAAKARLSDVADVSLRDNLGRRAEKMARSQGASQVEETHIAAFLDMPGAETGSADTPSDTEQANNTLHWSAAALARLMRVPEGLMRDASKQRIEEYAHQTQATEITLAVAEAGLQQAREAMAAQRQEAPGNPAAGGTCPFAHTRAEGAPADGQASTGLAWSAEALGRLEHIPPGMSRDMTRKAAEAIAASQGREQIDIAFLSAVLDTFQAGSEQTRQTLAWDDAARAGIERAPSLVQGMLMREIEAWARRHGLERVNEAAVQTVKTEWARRGNFHLDPDDARSGER